MRLAQLCTFIMTMIVGGQAHAQTTGARRSPERLGPSFDCASQAAVREALPQIICSDDRLARLDLMFVQAFQALRHQVGEAGQRDIRREATEFQSAVLQRCGLPQSGILSQPQISSAPACVTERYQSQRQVWMGRLNPQAREEAERPVEDHIALQVGLQQLGYIPRSSTADGVYGPTTRLAITAWQRTSGLAETGFLASRDADNLQVELFFVGSRPATPVQSSGEDWLDQRVDLNRLTRTEVQLLQDALIWNGTYVGLKDGIIGRTTLDAVQSWLQSWRRNAVSNIHETATRRELSLLLSLASLGRLNAGWTTWYDPNAAIWIGYPQAFVTSTERIVEGAVTGTDYRGPRGFSLRTRRIPVRDIRQMMSTVTGNANVSRILYRLDRRDRQVASLDMNDGRILYFRFDRIGTEWRGFVASIGGPDRPTMNLIAATTADFSANGSPVASAPDDIPEFGPILARNHRPPPPRVASTPTPDVGPRAVEPPSTAPSPPSPAAPSTTSRQATPREPIGSGTAFVVRRDGMMLTNDHVINNCGRLALPSGAAVTVTARDRRRDLALVQAAQRFESVIRFRRDQTVDVGEAVFAFGFPLFGLTTTAMNLTNGIITSDVGLQDDPTRFQLNAAIQPGNSGGPIVDSAGLAIGVAVARLNDEAMMAATGLVAQSINFAVRGQVVESFLLDNRVLVEKAPRATAARPLPEVATEMRQLVFPLLCFR
jgi:S1-C subfamily serine protease